ncbi:MAG: hypothetical protein QOJ12_3199 [Thermoleophilales bacterium]|jgi:hypothetical protein|nr:hypothetical protein [Thermoleophilales bacterium]
MPTTSDERANRVARNEASFREINATLHEGLTAADLEQGERAAFVCECGDESCHALVQLPLARYEAVRAHPDRFIVVAGHEITDVERVVERAGSCAVVEKLDRGDALDIVRR